MREILLIADLPWVVEAVRATLGGAPYRLTVVTGSEEAVAQCREQAPAAVLADLQVGSRGGMAAIRDLRSAAAADGHHPPPTVLLLDRSADAFLAHRSGADAWIRKPFRGFALRRLLDRLVATEAATAPG